MGTGPGVGSNSVCLSQKKTIPRHKFLKASACTWRKVCLHFHSSLARREEENVK